jgi:hypothetical protein
VPTEESHEVVELEPTTDPTRQLVHLACDGLDLGSFLLHISAKVLTGQHQALPPEQVGYIAGQSAEQTAQCLANVNVAAVGSSYSFAIGNNASPQLSHLRSHFRSAQHNLLGKDHAR